jgi:hypothetical protein
MPQSSTDSYEMQLALPQTFGQPLKVKNNSAEKAAGFIVRMHKSAGGSSALL